MLFIPLDLVQHLPVHSLYFYNIIICATILKCSEKETGFLASVSNFPSFNFNFIIKYTVYIYRKHNVISHKYFFLRLQMGDERLGALAVHMIYHTLLLFSFTPELMMLALGHNERLS